MCVVYGRPIDIAQHARRINRNVEVRIGTMACDAACSRFGEMLKSSSAVRVYVHV